MRLAIYILLLFFSNIIWSQIIYTPIFINQCSNQVDPVCFSITDTNQIYFYQFDTSFSFNLPKAGNYLLHPIVGQPININISDTSCANDTFLVNKLTLKTLVSNPPFSEYLDCNSPANGIVVDYYFSKVVRMRGRFQDGQLIDSLQTYYRNGQLKEIIILTKKHKQIISYYENSVLESIHNDRKRYVEKYYEDGKLKELTRWNKKYKIKSSITLFRMGNIKVKDTNKKREIFDSQGLLRQKIKRKERAIVDRLVKRFTTFNNMKYYEYEWSFYNEQGTIERKIIFDALWFPKGIFPNDIGEIEKHLISEIIYFENGKEIHKEILY